MSMIISGVTTAQPWICFAIQILSLLIAPLNQRARRLGSLNWIGMDGIPKGSFRRRSSTLTRGFVGVGVAVFAISLLVDRNGGIRPHHSLLEIGEGDRALQ